MLEILSVIITKDFKDMKMGINCTVVRIIALNLFQSTVEQHDFITASSRACCMYIGHSMIKDRAHISMGCQIRSCAEMLAQHHHLQDNY